MHRVASFVFVMACGVEGADTGASDVTAKELFAEQAEEFESCDLAGGPVHFNCDPAGPFGSCVDECNEANDAYDAVIDACCGWIVVQDVCTAARRRHDDSLKMLRLMCKP